MRFTQLASQKARCIVVACYHGYSRSRRKCACLCHKTTGYKGGRTREPDQNASTSPPFCLWLRQCDGFVRRGERDGLIGNPRMSLAIDVKRPRKEFDFVPKEIECNRAGQVGQVFKFDSAERHRLLREIKNGGAVGIRRGLTEEDDLEIR